MNTQKTDFHDRIAHSSRQDPPKGTYGKGYSKFVRIMRLFLPLIAVVMMTIIFGWFSMKNDQIPEIKTIDDVQQEEVKNELLSPTFESVDEKNRPYKITAEKAVRDLDNEDLLVLSDPQAVIDVETGHQLSLKASAGRFWQLEKKLHLLEDVRLTDTQGYDIRTNVLRVNLEEQIAYSDDLVRGRGPAGTLESNGLAVFSETGILVLKGPAKVILQDTNIDLETATPTAPSP